MTILIKSAVKLVVDALVLVGMGAILGRKKGPRYVNLLLGSLVLALGFLAYDLLPRWMLGQLFVIPLFVGAAIVLAFFGRASWKWAALGAAIFVVTHYLIRWFV